MRTAANSTGITSESSGNVSGVEQHGIDVIPEYDRLSQPRDLFFVFFGSQMCFAIIVLGSLPITFGLGFWDSVGAITVGLFVGSLFFALLSPFGSRTGTSASLATGAHFGVSGRVIGTVIATFTALGCYALTVWTGGEAMAAATARLLGWQMSPHLMAAGAVMICLLTIIAAIYGHAIIVATEKIVSYGIAVILLIVAITLVPAFDPSYTGGNYVLQSYWPTWFLAMAVSAAIPVSYATWLNDYTRYIPSRTPTGELTLAAGGGMFIGCWIALVFAAAVTTMFKTPDTPFVAGIIGLVSWWAAALLALVGIIGSQPQGSLLLYGAGLSVQTVFPRLNRIPSTVLLSLIGLALVFTGIYVTNMLNMVTAFLVLDQCVIAPWLAIHLVGYRYVMRGKYVPEDLFAFERGGGGRYWYNNGWNINAIIAWVAGFFVGLMFVNTEFFSGPLSSTVGGVSLEWILAGTTGGFLYYVMEKRSGRINPP